MNATFSIVDFKTFLLVQTSKSSIQIASECTIKSFCFQNVRSSSNFKNIDSNCIRMHPCFQNILSRFNFQINASNWSRSHRLASLLSKFYRQFTTSKTSFQIAIECTVLRPWFKLPNHRFKLHQNAPLGVLAFRSFSAVPNAPFSVLDYKNYGDLEDLGTNTAFFLVRVNFSLHTLRPCFGVYNWKLAI